MEAGLIAKLEAEGESQQAAMGEMRGKVWHLVQQRAGCRVVQKALESLGNQHTQFIINELQGHVLESVESPYANHVVQRLIERSPKHVVGFVAEELMGWGLWAARHEYGCRIICRLLEHFNNEESTQKLISEILVESSTLSLDKFGHYVIESAIEHGQPWQRKQIVEALRNNLGDCLKNRWCLYVIESALLKLCDAEDRCALAAELLRHHLSGGVAALKKHRVLKVARKLVLDAQAAGQLPPPHPTGPMGGAALAVAARYGSAAAAAAAAPAAAGVAGGA